MGMPSRWGSLLQPPKVAREGLGVQLSKMAGICPERLPAAFEGMSEYVLGTILRILYCFFILGQLCRLYWNYFIGTIIRITLHWNYYKNAFPGSLDEAAQLSGSGAPDEDLGAPRDPMPSKLDLIKRRELVATHLYIHMHVFCMHMYIHYTIIVYVYIYIYIHISVGAEVP